MLHLQEDLCLLLVHLWVSRWCDGLAIGVDSDWRPIRIGSKGGIHNAGRCTTHDVALQHMAQRHTDAETQGAQHWVTILYLGF